MAEQRNNGEFHRADPGWRRRMQLLLALTVLLGIGALVALQLWLGRMHGSDLAQHDRDVGRVLASLCIVLGLAAAAFATWMFRLASATRAERRWPPSSMKTSADVKIRYLTSADALVGQLKGGAIGLALVAVALLGWAGWLLRSP